MKQKISACIVAFNEEKKIRRCLESLTWCDEIVVIDSFSSDQTPAICREYTPCVYQLPWPGYVEQVNRAIEKACNNWVLFIDADEEISAGLRDEVKAVFARDPADYVAYRFPRCVYYLGKWITHGDWYPDYKIRLFRRDCGKVVGRNPHGYVSIEGRVKTLKQNLNHYSYDNISDHLKTIDNFSTIFAKEKWKEGKRCNPISHFFVHPLWKFIKPYFFRLGFLDGMQGLVVAIITSFEVAIKYIKLWEMQQGLENKKPIKE